MSTFKIAKHPVLAHIDQRMDELMSRVEQGSSSGGNDGGGMGPRIDRLENDVRSLHSELSAVRSDTAAVRAAFDHSLPNLATKSEVKDVKHDMIKWVIGVGVATTAALVAAIAAASQYIIAVLDKAS